MSALHESDFNFWLQEQTRLLKEHRFEELDIVNLIEEMEDLGGSFKSAIQSHLTIILQHMLKNKFQPDLTCNSWNASISGGRECIETIMEENPSLKKYPKEVLEKSYKSARKRAIKESGLKEDVFPLECPWSLDEILG